MRTLPLALALLLAPLGARAQGWSIGRYSAPPSGEDLNATERALVTPHLRVGGLLAIDWARSLAVVPIEHRVTAHLVATVGFFGRVQLGVAMPVVATQQISGVSGSFAPGDLRVDARVRVLGLERRGSGRLALAATLLLPTGDGGAYAGDGSVGVIPRVLVELTNARDFVFAANIGVAVRPGWENQLLARAGLTIPVFSRVLLSAEASFETLLRDPVADGALSLEVLGGLHHVAANGLALGLAAGPRLLDGEGSADLRVIGLVGYAPQPVEAYLPPRDSDRDGLVDVDDRCPQEPMGDRPDPNRRGCPARDTDRDGLRDDLDACPTEPTGDDPDPNRAGCPRDHSRDDGDGDGVPDREDVCPVESAGAHPDAARRGCPDPDIDHDDISNEHDACPEDRGPATSDAATNGCPRVFVSADRVVIQQQPRFATNRAVILPESESLLLEVAQVLEAHPELLRVEVQGHTDDRGTRALNGLLSQRRAESICAYLRTRGIAAERLVPRGYGDTRPLVDNATDAGRARNRRVEFVVVERRP